MSEEITIRTSKYSLRFLIGEGIRADLNSRDPNKNPDENTAFFLKEIDKSIDEFLNKSKI